MGKKTNINKNQQPTEEQTCQDYCDEKDVFEQGCNSDAEKDSEDVLDSNENNEQIQDPEDVIDTNENNEQIQNSEDVLSKTKTELAEVKDKYLRLMAEFDNYRKRVIKEKTDLILNGGEKVLTSILPVLDDFERAEANMDVQTDIESLKEGITLIIDKLKHTLEQNGLRRVNPVGEIFNVDFHEAIAMVPGNPDELKGKVIDCVQCGYLLNDKVIRHAKVAVAE